MHVRMTAVKPHADLIEEMKAIYNAEVVPVVTQAHGNMGAYLLEPDQAGDEYISVTMWDDRANAEAYEASGLYKEMVDKVRHTFAERPTLRLYES